MIKFYIPSSEHLYTFQNTKYNIQNSLMSVTKTCEKVLRSNMTSTTKVKVEEIQS